LVTIIVAKCPRPGVSPTSPRARALGYPPKRAISEEKRKKEWVDKKKKKG
jgi:hypothetical protein